MTNSRRVLICTKNSPGNWKKIWAMWKPVYDGTEVNTIILKDCLSPHHEAMYHNTALCLGLGRWKENTHWGHPLLVTSDSTYNVLWVWTNWNSLIGWPRKLAITILEDTYSFSICDIIEMERNPAHFLLLFSRLNATDLLQACWSRKGNNESCQPCGEAMSLDHLQDQAVDQDFFVCNCVYSNLCAGFHLHFACSNYKESII